MPNAENRIVLERERERESCNLKVTAVLACVKGKISLQTGRLYIIYRRLKVDMGLLYRQAVF